MSVRLAEGTHMTLRAAAELLGVHENTIRNWIDAGKLPAFRLPVSGFRRLVREDVESLHFGIVRKREGILYCEDCGRATSGLEASLRRFNTDHCGWCNGELS